MTRQLFIIMALCFATTGCSNPTETRIGSKVDNESVLLGEMATALVRSSGTVVQHRRELGGTPVLWEALKAGQIEVYPEFTGTLAFQIFNDPTLVDLAKLRAKLLEQGIGITRPLGYENNYALGVRVDMADKLKLQRISDLLKHPDLKLGMSTEFTRRKDGWPALKSHYALPFGEPRALEHAIAYQALVAGQIDVTDVYTTDAEIERFQLRILQDDRKFFPSYAAVFLYRLDWAKQHPDALATLEKLEGKLDETAIRKLNIRTQAGEPEAAIARDAVQQTLGIATDAVIETRTQQILRHTVEHLILVAISLTAAIVVAIPLGVFASRQPRWGQLIIGIAGLVQTIPSLALLVFMVAIPVIGGLGARPAIIALFFYSLLPIIRNTATGLRDIPLSLHEAAEGIGLKPWAKLRLVELPMASRSIIAGIKTAAIINIGTATLGALIDAGGLGVPIQQGLRLQDKELILLGAIPAAGLALVAQGLFEIAEWFIVPKGLQLTASR